MRQPQHTLRTDRFPRRISPSTSCNMGGAYVPLCVTGSERTTADQCSGLSALTPGCLSNARRQPVPSLFVVNVSDIHQLAHNRQYVRSTGRPYVPLWAGVSDRRGSHVIAAPSRETTLHISIGGRQPSLSRSSLTANAPCIASLRKIRQNR